MLKCINKLKLIIFSFLTLAYKISGLRLAKRMHLKIFEVEYELTIGMGELNTIIHTNLLKDYLKVDGFVPSNCAVCVDVGANIGSTSLIWAKTVNGGKILLFALLIPMFLSRIL